MKEQVINLENKSLEQLKVFAYDCNFQVNMWTKNLQEVEKVIQKKVIMLSELPSIESKQAIEEPKQGVESKPKEIPKKIDKK